MPDYDPLDESDEGEGQGQEDDEEFRHELSEDERESVEADLEDLDSMRAVFEAQGAKGVVIACTECGSNHYYGRRLRGMGLRQGVRGRPLRRRPGVGAARRGHLLRLVRDAGRAPLRVLSQVRAPHGRAPALS